MLVCPVCVSVSLGKLSGFLFLSQYLSFSLFLSCSSLTHFIFLFPFLLIVRPFHQLIFLSICLPIFLSLSLYLSFSPPSIPITSSFIYPSPQHPLTMFAIEVRSMQPCVDGTAPDATLATSEKEMAGDEGICGFLGRTWKLFTWAGTQSRFTNKTFFIWVIM